MAGAAVAVMTAVASCSFGGLVNSDQLPSDVSDPAVTQTPAGARNAYIGSLAQFGRAFGGISTSGQISFVAITGRLSDELVFVNGGSSLDRRALPEAAGSDANATYANLQKVRGQASQAIGLLTRYRSQDSALVGHLYAIEGYAELLLAELFCSGVPLGTLDYNGDFTYKAGSTTTQVFQHAVSLFDTALTLAADTTRFMDLARVGRGRALLNLGAYTDAAAAVASVSDDYRYDVTYNSLGTTSDSIGSWQNFARVADGSSWGLTVPDREGTNGLDWRTSGDPRTPIRFVSTGPTPFYYPSQYTADGASPIALASGLEARLIQAEAGLRAGDISTWLTALNRLRVGADVTVPPDTVADTLGVSGCGAGSPICGHSPGGDDSLEFGQPAGGFPVPAGYTLASIDTTYPAPSGVGGPGGLCDQRSWYRPCYQGDSMVVYLYVSPSHTAPGPGTGGVMGLASLTDPGTPDGRVDLQFRERAFWLFLTGHRQGDLRRLIRQYGRPQYQVYPVGAFPIPGSGPYGSDVTAPIPVSEFANPLYTGCLSRDA